MFSVTAVDPRQSETPESLGTKRKFWYLDTTGTRWLFKAEERGSGEDWSEKVCCELAALIGLPHVHYELAKETGSGTPGVICQSIAGGASQLVLGNQLLLERDASYPVGEVRHYKVRAHTVQAVADVILGLGAPTADWSVNLPSGVASALDVFVGYVMLDVFVANQDRHHENWGALRMDGVLRLAPSFDHGASLARNLSDEERKARLASTDRGYQVSGFANRARSAFYDSESATRADAYP